MVIYDSCFCHIYDYEKTEPLIALLAGALLGGVAAIIFQPDLVVKVAEGTQLTFNTAYKGVLTALTTKTSVATTHPELNDLLPPKVWKECWEPSG